MCYEFGGLIHGGAYFRNVTVRYINLLGRCSKEKPRARAPGSNFLSLSNACYAGYIYLFYYLFISSIFGLFYFFVSLSPNHPSIIIPLKKCLVKDRMNNVSVPSRGACFKTSDQASCLFIYFIYFHFLYRKEPAIDILRAKSLGLLLGPVHTEIASVVSVVLARFERRMSTGSRRWAFLGSELSIFSGKSSVCE